MTSDKWRMRFLASAFRVPTVSGVRIRCVGVLIPNFYPHYTHTSKLMNAFSLVPVRKGLDWPCNVSLTYGGR